MIMMMMTIMMIPIAVTLVGIVTDVSPAPSKAFIPNSVS